MTKVRTALFTVLVGITVFATVNACSGTDRAVWTSSSATAPPAADSSGNPADRSGNPADRSGKPLPTPTPTVDAKQVLSTICSTIPTTLVASLFHASGVKVAQDSVDQHGQWESTTCGITGSGAQSSGAPSSGAPSSGAPSSGALSLSAFAQIGPPSVSAQDGLNPIIQQSGVSDVHQLSGVGTAGAAVEFRQKVDSITENVVCAAKQTSTGTVVMGIVDADNHGYQPLIQLLSQLAT